MSLDLNSAESDLGGGGGMGPISSALSTSESAFTATVISCASRKSWAFITGGACGMGGISGIGSFLFGIMLTL